jgi:uncharacterized protein (DUF58 family)
VAERRTAFWINVAAGLALAIVLSILSAVLNLGLLAVAAVAGFLLIYVSAVWLALKLGARRLLATANESEPQSAVRKLRLLRRIGVHFLLNRHFYDAGDVLIPSKQLVDFQQDIQTWDNLVTEIRPEAPGADNEWERYEVLGNMKSPNYISEKIDRLDEVIKKLS